MTHRIDSKTTPGGLSAGEKIGKYQIVQRLGAGGESIVYKAYDPLLDRHVAIKQVAPHLAADEAFARRFRGVMRQLAKLQCEQIVTIHDLLEDSGGMFVVMEFVEGHTLETMLSQSPAPAETKAALQIIWRIAAGLSAIHRAEIVHRDIKPGNIIISEGLRVKITDFGVAAQAGAPVSMKLGTTKYMAPELFAGESVDARCDIYSLGFIAYEMLAGRTRFNEIFHDIVRDPHSEALRWMKWHSAPEQVAPPLREVNPAVPPSLAAIIEKMLAKRPEDRYANVEVLGRESRANFSPRGAARQAAKAQLRAGGRAAPAAAAAAAVATAEPPAGAAATGVLAGDEELVVGDTTAAGEGPLTAEIPKEPMSLRAKLVLAGAAIVVLLGGVLAASIIAGGKVKELSVEAAGRLAKVDESYRRGTVAKGKQEKATFFAAALDAARTLTAEPRYTKYSSKAEMSDVLAQAATLGHLANAYGIILKLDEKALADPTAREKWRDGYSTALSGARDMVSRLQQRNRLPEFTGARQRDIDQCKKFAGGQEEYYQLLADVKTALADQDLLTVREKLDSIVPTGLLEEQKSLVQQLKDQLAQAELQKTFDARLAVINEAAANGNMREAVAGYRELLTAMDNEFARLSTRDAMAANLRDKLGDIDRTQKLEVLRRDARKAEMEGNLLTAVDKYEQMLRLKPNEPGVADKPAELRYRHHIGAARAAVAAGRLGDADRELKEADKYKPNGGEIQDLRAQIQKSRDYQSLLGQAQNEKQQKHWDAAEKLFVEARPKAPSDQHPMIDANLADVRYNRERDLGDAARAAKNWGKARQHYIAAKQFKPSATAEIDARVQAMSIEQRYTDLMTAANAAREKKNWKEALDRVEDARRVRATPEAEDLLNLIRYEQMFASAVESFNTNDFNSALAYANRAKSYKSTPEIDAFIAKCAKAKEDAGKSGGS